MQRRKTDSHFLALSLTFLPRRTPVLCLVSTSARAWTAAPGLELPARGRVPELRCLPPRPLLPSGWPQRPVTPAWGAQRRILNLRVKLEAAG